MRCPATLVVEGQARRCEVGRHLRPERMGPLHRVVIVLDDKRVVLTWPVKP